MGRKPDGSVDRRHVRGKTKSVVTAKVTDLEDQRRKGDYAGVHQIHTVEQWLRHWVEHHDVRAKSRAAYRTAVYKHLIPGLGQHSLKSLRAHHVETFYKTMYDTMVEDKQGKQERKYRPATVHQVHRTLRTALADAVKKSYLGTNPAAGAAVPTDQSSGAADWDVETFTVHEARSILAATEEVRAGVRYVIAMTTGLRQGECLGLKWDKHVSLDNDPMAELNVREQLQRQTWQHDCGERRPDGTHPCGRKRGCDCPRKRDGGLVQVTVKSKAGKRDVSLDPITTDALRAWRRQQKEERLAAGSDWHDTGYVFTKPNGKPVDPRVDYENWRSLLAKAGVREARLHDARHTAATILLVQGVDPRIAMELMGWSTAAMLARYQHVIKALRAEAASKVGTWMYGGASREGSSDSVRGEVVT